MGISKLVSNFHEVFVLRCFVVLNFLKGTNNPHILSNFAGKYFSPTWKIIRYSDEILSNTFIFCGVVCWNAYHLRFLHCATLRIKGIDPHTPSFIDQALSFVHRRGCFTNNSSTFLYHYDVIMSAMASQITSVSILCSTVCSGADKKNTKASRHWPLWGKSTGDRWISLTKCQ